MMSSLSSTDELIILAYIGFLCRVTPGTVYKDRVLRFKVSRYRVKVRLRVSVRVRDRV